MFENLLHQDQIRDALQHSLANNCLAPACLFIGPAHSGKLTAALELARVLGCKSNGAPWSCTCSSCTQHRLLDSPSTLFLGNRHFTDEIHAAGKMLAQTNSEGLRFLFLRNIKKLIRRFDPPLWEDDKTKLNKAAKLIERLESLLTSAPLPPNLATLGGLISEIEKLIPTAGMSINMIRRAIYWARTTDRLVTRTVIIENADSMNESVRHSLLKILEEPPSQLFFILTTTRPEAILPTIRSRLRSFNFRPRGKTEFRNIISRVYRHADAERYDSLQAFFDDLRKGGLEQQQRKVTLMFTLLRNKDMRARDQLNQLIGSDRQELRRVLVLCLAELQHSRRWNADCMELQKKIEEINYRCAMYNIPVASALEHGYI